MTSRSGQKKCSDYLKDDVKAIVNRIVDELAADDRIASFYDLWYEQKEEILRTYKEIVACFAPFRCLTRQYHPDR